MKYIIYFDFFGKKMKHTLEANCESEAEYLLRGKINVINIINESVEDNYILDFLKGFKK